VDCHGLVIGVWGTHRHSGNGGGGVGHDKAC